MGKLTLARLFAAK
jgi:hypothetical protein